VTGAQAPSPGATAIPSTCAACGRRHVIVTGPGAGEARCACGGELVPEPLPPGIYEVVPRPQPGARRPPTAAGHDRHGGGDAGRAHAPHAPPPHEADLGYGESHGYGPAHGGPTGPGDAPATDADEPAEPEREGGRGARGAPDHVD
jgi:hypothetical protein